MEIGKWRNKQRTITAVFLRYVCLFPGGALLLLALLAGIFVALIAWGAVLPANYAERMLNENAAELKSAPEITEEMMPPECMYGVYGREGNWLYGTFSGEERKTAWAHYRKNNIYTNGRGYYRFFDRDTGEVCIVHYRVIVLFRNPFLNKYLPRIEVLLIILYVVLFLVYTVVVSRHFGKYMRNRLMVLNEVTGEIKNQNLEFDKRHSELKEVEEVLDSLYQMKEALEASLLRQWDLEKSREEQIAALAHDIKTPLTVIRGNAELLAEGELAEDEAEYNRDILRSVSIMEEYLAMLHEILQAGWMGAESTREPGKTGERQIFCEVPAGEEGEQKSCREGVAGEAEEQNNCCEKSAGKMENKQISCEELAGKMEEQARLLVSARQCAADFGREALQGTIRGNESQMLRAFQNIVSNALDYSPAGKGIRIRFSNLEKDGRMYLAAAVMDEGPGFSAEDLKYAAERFYQGDKSRSSKVHYGIGLHTARQFAKSQGGYLVIANGEEGGAKVTLHFRLLEKRTK